MTIDQREIVSVSCRHNGVVSDSGCRYVNVGATSDLFRAGIGLPEWLQGAAQQHSGENPRHLGSRFEDAEFAFYIAYGLVKTGKFGGIVFAYLLDAEVNFEIDELGDGGGTRMEGRKPTLHDGATLSVEDLPHNIGVEYIQHRTVPEWPIKMRAVQLIRNLPVRMPVGKRCQIPSNI